MTTTERLLRIAGYFINHLSPIPLDLAARLMERGVDIETLEYGEIEENGHEEKED